MPSVSSLVCRLEGLSLLLTRETNLETPQIFIKKWPEGPQAESSERLLTQFPHPHPSIKDLQKEVIRSATARPHQTTPEPQTSHTDLPRLP